MLENRGYKIYFFRLLRTFWSHPFILLTLIGNGFIVTISLLMYLVEHGRGMASFGDALWWSFATVTTVGYGDIVPTTSLGRFFGIIAMLGGTGPFACYTAVFTNAFIGKTNQDK